jgi:hypothetical protein
MTSDRESLRALVLAPIGRDAVAAADLLQRAGVATERKRCSATISRPSRSGSTERVPLALAAKEESSYAYHGRNLRLRKQLK